jgi:hypothetical protein
MGGSSPTQWDAYRVQSSGTGSMPHTLPGLCSSMPNSQIFSYSPREKHVTTWAVTVRVGKPCNSTAVPISTG